MKKTSTIIRVLKYLSKYTFYMIVSIVVALVTVAGQLYIPILQGDAIDKIVEKGNVDFKGIMQIIMIILITMAVVALLQWVMNICNNKITYSVIRDIRKDAFNKLQNLPVKYADSHPTGEIVNKVIADVDQFADGLLMGFSQFFTGVMTIIGTLIFMLMINWKITLVVVLITPLSFFVASFVAKKTYTMFHKQSETRGRQTAFIDEMIGNQKVVQAYSHEDESLEKFDVINKELQKYSLDATFFSSITNPSTRFVNNVVYALVCLSGAFTSIATKGVFSVGQLSAFLSYAQQYTKPFNEISGVVTELQNALACADRILDLIEEEPLLPDAEDELVVEEGQGRIEIENVSFSYDKSVELRGKRYG